VARSLSVKDKKNGRLYKENIKIEICFIKHKGTKTRIINKIFKAQSWKPLCLKKLTSKFNIVPLCLTY